jgi:2'-5' RNA ligase
MEKHYSVVIHPSPEIIAEIKGMKDHLAEEVGWFHSKNSVAHVTICEFKATDKELDAVKKQLTKLCAALSPLTVHLDGFGNFYNSKNGKYAFFIAPNEESRAALKPIMKRFHNALPVKTFHHSDVAHLTIGRGLTINELKVAEEMFTNINESFLCDAIVLRILDMTIQQFRVIDTFEFKGNPQPESIQGTLF